MELQEGNLQAAVAELLPVMEQAPTTSSGPAACPHAYSLLCRRRSDGIHHLLVDPWLLDGGRRQMDRIHHLLVDPAPQSPLVVLALGYGTDGAMGTESGARVAGEIGEKSFEPVLWGREHGGAAREDGDSLGKNPPMRAKMAKSKRSHGIPEGETMNSQCCFTPFQRPGKRRYLVSPW
ncbi:hypothetical protein OsI_27670 [Oryza sativa Indica Group]|uniref:Uncharacterized protein n=1 Tax=Oryza sativa subsp. indica TaxID=39946 RepID=A2YQU5_ORYSI|nr:hypothetical protein OsI_27670 [Oryza sativa Indica Group]